MNKTLELKAEELTRVIRENMLSVHEININIFGHSSNSAGFIIRPIRKG